MYRCEATSAEGFVQQLAVSYLGSGYWFYVAGEIPAGKDSRRVDEKLVTRYEIALSKWARARRKRAGLANLQYLRFGRFFVLLATHGRTGSSRRRRRRCGTRGGRPSGSAATPSAAAVATRTSASSRGITSG